MELTLNELQVDCEGGYSPWKSAKFDSYHGAWVPSEGGEVSDFKVYLTTATEKIEITKFLSDTQIHELKTDFIDEKES